MELGLSLGDTRSKPLLDGLIAKASDGFATTATTTTAAATGGLGLGFCMSLGINTSNGTIDHHQDEEEEEEDDDDDDDENNTASDQNQEISMENNGRRIRELSSSLNPPVQLDLLPLAPVPRHTPLPWSSDNGSSEGGSSGNGPAGSRRQQAVAVAAEEATSSFRLEFGGYSYSRNGNIITGSNNNHHYNNNNNNINNHKRDIHEIGNDVVEAERASSRASDEDENGLCRKKLRLSKEQSAFLEESFKEHNTLNPKQKLLLAKQLNLRPRQVEVWFQNRRARTKLKQTEVDCEYLKRCCETLTEENRRLHKELQELRALKSNSNPFYMQLPATTLTMCPSCERVATTSAAATPPPPPSVTDTKTNYPMEPSKPSGNTVPFPPTSAKTKPRSFYPFTDHAPPSSNSNHRPATPS